MWWILCNGWEENVRGIKKVRDGKSVKYKIETEKHEEQKIVGQIQTDYLQRVEYVEYNS